MTGDAVDARPTPAPVLDIGAGIGAALVHLAAPPPSGEVWVCPRGAPGEAVHTGVHRHAGGWYALFPHLGAGHYSVLDGPVEGTGFRVVGGEVAEIREG